MKMHYIRTVEAPCQMLMQLLFRISFLDAGSLDVMLMLPFHGPLHDSILTILDTEGLDQDTLDRVHELLELRMNLMDAILREIFTTEVAALEMTLPGKASETICNY